MKIMNTKEEKILELCNELTLDLEERFYLLDTDFDSTNCNLIFYIICKLFIQKNLFSLFNKKMREYIDNCFLKINLEEKQDFRFLYNNLNLLTINNLIDEKDVMIVKQMIDSYIEIKKPEEKNKVLTLSNIG